MSERVPLAGSERLPLHPAQPVGPVGDTPIEVTVVLRRSNDLTIDPSAPLTRQEYAARHGASPDDIARVREFAAEHGLTVADVDPNRRRVELTGTAAQMEAAFGTQLQRVEHNGETYRARTGPLHVPAELADIVVAVLGLDDRPQARPLFRALPARRATTGFTPLEIGTAYDFPTDADGSGQTVAILELGGGYTTDDLTTYFNGLGVTPPTVEAVPVDGGSNAPSGDPSSADGEVLLDIEVVGALAPGATIAVYFAPNTDRGFLDALTAAVHDQQRAPSVVSISWGSAEANWTAQAMTAFDQACADAAALGVTVCVAAGDDGSSDRVSDNQPHVDFPASSPHVLACGGTKLVLSNGVAVETVWNELPDGGATGGGVSSTFPRPDWQKSITMPPDVPADGGRGVPDVAGDADPQTGYRVRVDGSDMVIGGTSAVAPLWAALLARIASGGTSVGFVLPQLYAATAGAFHDITEGSNGAYAAAPGWDACTGLGTPVGTALASLLRGGPPPA